MSTSFGDKLTCSVVGPWGKDPAGHEKGTPELTKAQLPAGGAQTTSMMAGGSLCHPCLAQPELCDLGQGPESPEPQEPRTEHHMAFNRITEKRRRLSMIMTFSPPWGRSPLSSLPDKPPTSLTLNTSSKGIHTPQRSADSLVEIVFL